MKPTPKSARRDGGFSLVELLIVAALTPVILGAAYLAFGAMTSNYSKIEAASEATGEAQRGLDTLVRELRQGRQIQEGGGAFSAATTSTCAFYCDADLDGAPERITYYVADGTDLYRMVGRRSAVPPYNFVDEPAVRVLNIAGMTSQAVFTYYNSAGDQLTVSNTNMNTISAVGVHLVATRASQGGLVSVDFSTKVKIRALFNSVS